MNKVHYGVGVLLLLLFDIFLIYEGFFIMKSAFVHYANYGWTLAGIAGFMLLHHYTRSHWEWFKTFTHELTHIIAGAFFLRKVHSFRADESTGEVQTSGNNRGLIASTLAPYCLPIYTYLFLLIRCIVSYNHLWICDLLLGASIAFHAVCFKEQTGSHQTDIRSYPSILSYHYIWTFRIFNLLIILLALLKSNVFGAFQYLIVNLWKDLCHLGIFI